MRDPRWQTRRWALAWVWGAPPLVESSAVLFGDLGARIGLDTLVVTDTLAGKLDFLGRGVLALTVDELAARSHAEAAWVTDAVAAELGGREPAGGIDRLGSAPASGAEPSAEPAPRAGGFDPIAVSRARAIRRLAAAYERLASELSPSCAFVWNGWLAESAALALVARRLGVPAFFLERGLLPGTLTIDPVGVNYGSHLAGPAWSAARAPPPDSQARERIRALAAALARTGHTVVAQGERLSPADARRKLGLATSERVVLLPLQLEHDSNVVAHSPHFSRMADVVAAVHAALRDQPGAVLVVRPHPEAHGPLDLPPAADAPRVLTAPGVSLHALLAVSDVVVTINSTVGLEAVLQEKPVVVLGHAVYGEKGFTFDVTARDALGDVVARALRSGGLSDEARRERDRFLAYLLGHGLFALDPADPWGSRPAIAAAVGARLGPAGPARLRELAAIRALVDVLEPSHRGRPVLLSQPDGHFASELRAHLARVDPGARVDVLSRGAAGRVALRALLGRYRGAIATGPLAGARGLFWRWLPLRKATLVDPHDPAGAAS